VLTALRPEPERRYASAGSLGEEIGRFLEGRAVLAQPDTVRYRVRKFVGRNRLAVASAAVLVTSLAAFGGMSAWQARVLSEQRRVAQRERHTSEQVVRVLVDLFETTNPSVRPDGDRMPLGEFLEGAQARALAQLREAPAVRAKLQQVFGLIHQTRGQYAPARRALEEALEQQRRLAGPDQPEALESLQRLGEVCHYGGDDERARSLLEESLERHRRTYGDLDPRTARVLEALAPVVAKGDMNKAGELLRRSLEIRRAALGPSHPDLASSLSSLAGYHFQRQEYERARELFRQALDVFSRPQDRRHPLVITILSDLASVLGQMNAHAEAEDLQREALGLGMEILGAKSIAVANLLNNLGTTQALRGRHRDAERSFREAFEAHVALVGEDHWRTRNVARNVGRALALQQRYAEAVPWMDRALPAAAGGAEDAGVLGLRAQRAQILFRVGRRAEAVEEATAAVDALERLPASDGERGLAGARVLLGRMLVESGRSGEAEPRLTAAFAWLERLGPEHPQRAEGSCELARVRLLRGGGVEERRRLTHCLPIYRAWGLAEPEVVRALERLLLARPS